MCPTLFVDSKNPNNCNKICIQSKTKDQNETMLDYLQGRIFCNYKLLRNLFLRLRHEKKNVSCRNNFL